ncbi:MAG: SGNH/GDSL hydrolase family protein [Clostridia bacterium]|nr:SGNH/GDSL hydrolase family protein [Clostridia bacterium]
MRILFQGDSITDGNRYKDVESRWDKNHQIGHAYPYIVTGLLGLEHWDKGLEFINRGVSGNRTEELLERWQVDTLEEKPDVLIMLIGTNDSKCGYAGCEYDKDASGFRERYERLLQMAREQNPDLKLVILEPFAYVEDQAHTPNISGEFVQMKLNNIQRVCREIAEKYGAIFVPLQALFDEKRHSPNKKYWMWDGVHPTEAGHAMVAKEVIKVLENLICK